MTIALEPQILPPGQTVEMPVDVIIPARNEADTIGGVVRAFTLSPSIGNIIVVCNQCDDETPQAARENGAHVLEQNKETGKGQTLKVGLDYVETERVMFCDADLRGPIAEYITAIASPYPGKDGMIIGVTDYPILSPVPWRVPRDIFAQVSGQRSLPTRVARSVELHGYAVEVMINKAIMNEGLPIEYVYMRGVKGKVRQNSRRMAELRRDQKWLRENWSG
jgi:glycosyltransferase involved in cell wall biosynthesis